MTETVHGRTGDTERALDVHYRFILWLIPTLERFPRSQKFLLGDRIQNAAIDVLEALIESACTKNRDEPLSRANLGIEKLRFFIRLCRDLKHLAPRRHENAVCALDRTGRRIGYWNSKPRNLRSANRSRNESGNRNNNRFRVARTLHSLSRMLYGDFGNACRRSGTVLMRKLLRLFCLQLQKWSQNTL